VSVTAPSPLDKSRGGRRTVIYRDALGRTWDAVVQGPGSNKTHSVTITTTTGTPNIVATAGTFSALDVGAAISGDDANTGAGRTILSVQDSTHATMSGNAAATDAVGTAATLTRTVAANGYKVAVTSRRSAGSGAGAIFDNVPLASSLKGSTAAIINRSTV
jgi:hypothetical protein